MTARHDVADLWDHVLAEWMEGRELWLDPAYPDLTRWFTSYTGAVDLRHYPDPYVGDLRGDTYPPRLILLGLNPGVGYDELQARGGVWAEGIRLHGNSRFRDRVPYRNDVWTRLHGKDSPYWRNLVRFAQRWTGDLEFDPHSILNMELYPWHSNRVEGAMRPPADVLEKHVWAPLGEVDLPIMFAFGRPWLDVCDGLGLPRVLWRGDHQDADGPLPVKNWNVVVYTLPSGQRVVVSWQPGFAGPPGEQRTVLLRRLLADHGLST